MVTLKWRMLYQGKLLHARGIIFDNYTNEYTAFVQRLFAWVFQTTHQMFDVTRHDVKFYTDNIMIVYRKYNEDIELVLQFETNALFTKILNLYTIKSHHQFQDEIIVQNYSLDFLDEPYACIRIDPLQIQTEGFIKFIDKDSNDILVYNDIDVLFENERYGHASQVDVDTFFLEDFMNWFDKRNHTEFTNISYRNVKFWIRVHKDGIQGILIGTDISEDGIMVFKTENIANMLKVLERRDYSQIPNNVKMISSIKMYDGIEIQNITTISARQWFHSL
jgi:hypothetical protein